MRSVGSPDVPALTPRGGPRGRRADRHLTLDCVRCDRCSDRRVAITCGGPGRPTQPRLGLSHAVAVDRE